MLCLQAPGKQAVNAVGDFNGWMISDQNRMTRQGDLFWITIGNLVPGKEYIFQYWIDNGAIKIGDPFCEKIVDAGSDKEIIADATYPDLIRYERQDGIASVFRAGLPPAIAAPVPFKKPAPENLLIYELLVRDFVKSHSYREVKDSLGYFKRLGVNAIELMPTVEFENNSSWGYNPIYFTAADKYYGRAEDLKALIQAAHAQGLAVISDIVLNQAMGQSPLVKAFWDNGTNAPMANGPYANPSYRHPFVTGFDLNYESPYTMAHAKRVIRYWLEDFHFDGFRFDLAKGLTQTNTVGDYAAWAHYDQSRINILTELGKAAKQADPDVYLILEQFADNDEEKVLSALGFMIWGNSTYDHRGAMAGDLSKTFTWANAEAGRGWDEKHLVAYMESHDEERVMAFAAAQGSSNNDYDIRRFATACDRDKLAFLFLVGIPGPKLLWQFGEWADDRPRGSTENAQQTGRKPMPDIWRSDANRQRVWSAYASILDFRNRFNEAFRAGTFSWKPDGAVRWWKIRDASINAYAVGNFGVIAGNFKPGLTGTWYDYFSREKVDFKVDSEIPLKPGEFHLFVDRAVFALYGNPTDFTVSKTLNPEPVTALVSHAPGLSGKARRSGSNSRSIFQAEFHGTLKDLSGRQTKP